ncbi:hypothetical protein OROGR_007531 [Orobanche gracilis]
MRRLKAIRRHDIFIEENAYGGMTQSEVSQAQEKEHQLAQQDLKMERTKEKKNALEAYVYETRNKKANLLDRVVEKIGRKLFKVFVEVNTSGETSKFGAQPALCVDLVKHIVTECPNLELCGLMTIGMLDYSSTPENFKTLSNCRSEACTSLGLSEEKCELSMGMTADFERAIEMGSTTVKIGTTIFGVFDRDGKYYMDYVLGLELQGVFFLRK